MRDPRPPRTSISTAPRRRATRFVGPHLAAVLTVALGISTTAAQAGDPQCEQCCADAGAYSCPTRLQVYAEGSELALEGSGWRVRGLWVLDCDAGAGFDAAATVVLPREPVEGEVVTAARKPEALDCFQDWCQLPANACLTDNNSGAHALRRCTDGQPMRASELLRRGAAPPAVYVPPLPSPAETASKPRPAVGPASTAASSAARDHAQPEAVFVTRTVVVSGGKTEVHETTTSSATGTTTTSVRPADRRPDTPPAPARPSATSPSATTSPPSTGASSPAAPSLRIVAGDGAGTISTPLPRPNPGSVPPPSPTIHTSGPPPSEPPAPAAPPQPSRPSLLAESTPSSPPTATTTHADIRVDDAVEDIAEPPEYPPHLPAAGPLPITLDFDLPPEPGARCHTSAAVAREATRRLDLGDEARISGDNQTAVDEYRAAATLDRCNAIAWAALGQLAMQADDLDKARYALEIAVQLRPEHYGALTNLGLTWEALGRCRKATDAWHRVLELRRDHPPAVAGLARCGAAP